MPSQVFLDSPFLETGLTAYYDLLGDKAPRKALAASYADLKIPVERIRKFAQAVGVHDRLEVIDASYWKNPDWSRLFGDGGNRTKFAFGSDYSILNLRELLSRPCVELSKLVWKTMCNLPRVPDRLLATYQRNAKRGSRSADSQLVHILRDCAWVPQTGGRFVRPSEANKEDLPEEGFAFDAGYEWIKKVQFGEASRERAVENAKRETVAKELGFSDSRTLWRARKFVALPQDEQERFLAEVERRQNTEFPANEPRDSKRRSERVGQQAENALDRVVEQRTRSVSIGREAVKEQTQPYLREQYTNADDEMLCQVCKAVMPFKLDDGSFYFEMVEFLPELKKRHYQNYLALCPNHAAMFCHANGSKGLMRSLFVDLETTGLEILLAQKEMTIQFTKTHIADLKVVIEKDEAAAETQES